MAELNWKSPRKNTRRLIISQIPALEEIHISQTNLSIITSTDFESFPALLYLFIRENKVSRISPGAFSSLLHLQTLDLGINEVELLPQERLHGLFYLRTLNLTYNKLRELEEFPSDLKSLQVIDISYNQIEKINKTTFQHLDNLAELYLYGNWISSISSDSFKSLKKLRILDLSRNYLENIPLHAFRSLETQIRSLKAEENPISCSCDSQELWEWLQEHQKLIEETGRRKTTMRASPRIKRTDILDLNPNQFCDQPLVVKIAIQDIQPYSMVVSWQSRNHSGLHGYQIAYHAVYKLEEIRGKIMDRFSRSVKLLPLFPGTRYLVCVIALGNWINQRGEISRISVFSRNEDGLDEWVSLSDTVAPYLVDSRFSKCEEVATLDITGNIHGGYGSLPDHGLEVQSILTRRLGLIIGCCMGIAVFIGLVSVLGYLKIQKQRNAIKRDQPAPPEYLSYRHFSIQSADASGQCEHPQFITNMNTTSFSS
ncbi:hypothetical protein FQR65_LT18261 [Abscondita terminalis]|nr:hypothetical protein FQR65_LT18261 [Abscondita terminalis]